MRPGASSCSECRGDTYVFDEDLDAAVPCPRCRPDEARRPRSIPAVRPLSSQDRRELEEGA